jgi:hypothetical protein
LVIVNCVWAATQANRGIVVGETESVGGAGVPVGLGVAPGDGVGDPRGVGEAPGAGVVPGRGVCVGACGAAVFPPAALDAFDEAFALDEVNGARIIASEPRWPSA